MAFGDTEVNAGVSVETSVGAVTVNIAALLATLPAALFTKTENVLPLSESWTDDSV